MPDGKDDFPDRRSDRCEIPSLLSGEPDDAARWTGWCELHEFADPFHQATDKGSASNAMAAPGKRRWWRSESPDVVDWIHAGAYRSPC